MAFVSLLIANGADDGCSANGAFNSTALANGFNPTVYYGGLRFQAVTVPQGAQITSASLVLKSAGTAFGGSGTNWGYWYGDAVDNSAGWSNSARPDQRTYTSARTAVAWSATNGASVPTDVTAIIQEIVSRAGWSSGNALSIVGDGGAGGDGLALFRETDGLGYVSQLNISFTTATSGSTGRGGRLSGPALVNDSSAHGMTNALIANSREDARARGLLNWLLDRLIYRGAKGRTSTYLGVKSEAQVYLGERDLF